MNPNWDDQSGDWQKLAVESEEPRYQALAAMLREKDWPTSILDVGCGEGVLAKYLPQTGHGMYHGVEPSREAALKARAAGVQVTHSTAEDFRFPAYQKILFNESVYYFADPWEVLEKYLNFLKPGGEMIVSIFQKPQTWREVLSRHMTNSRATRIVREFFRHNAVSFREKRIGKWLIFRAQF